MKEKIQVTIISQDGRLVAKEVNPLGERPNDNFWLYMGINYMDFEKQYNHAQRVDKLNKHIKDIREWDEAESKLRVFEIVNLEKHNNPFKYKYYPQDGIPVTARFGSTHTAQIIEGNKVIIL